MNFMRGRCNLDISKIVCIRILYCPLRLLLLEHVFTSTVLDTFVQNPFLRLAEVNFPREEYTVTDKLN